MGGYGSTRWEGQRTRPTTSQAHSMDVRRWHREGYLEPGREFQWEWRDGQGRMTAAIRVYAGSDGRGLLLRYLLNGEEVQQGVQLARTACTYGGDRPWFTCPSCARRAAKLYLWRGYARCRTCHGLAYPSQREDEPYRMRRKARKMRDSMGPTRPGGRYPLKPKRMRWKTYVRKIQTIQALEAGAQLMLIEKAGARFPHITAKLEALGRRQGQR